MSSPTIPDLSRVNGLLMPPSGRTPHATSSPVSRRWLLGISAIVVVSAVILFATGSALAAAGPALLSSVVYAIWRLPLRHTVLASMFGFVAFFFPGWVPAMTPIWAVVRPVFLFFNAYLNALTGASFLSFNGTELMIAALTGLLVIRVLAGIRVDGAGHVPVANAIFAFTALAFVGLLSLEVWGVIRGGDARSSLFQIRPMLWLPFMTVLFGYALRGPEDFITLAKVLTVATCIRIALGMYYFVQIWPLLGDKKPESMTGHHDSVLYVAVVFMWIAAYVHHPTRRRALPTLLVCAWIMVALALNSRRMAYVSLVGCLFVMYVMLQGRTKRRITKAFLWSLPALIPYLVISRTHSGGIFAPGAMVMSVSEQKDASSTWREAENFNLIQTLAGNKLLGRGWGHEYIEVLKLDDISKFMPQYKLVAHNSILWLIGVGGIVGFTVLWLPVPVGVYFAARSYRFARTPLEKAMAMSALGVMVCYANQSWGDMGTQGYVQTLLLAFALALSGKLARMTGAWPAHVRLLGRPRRVGGPGAGRGRPTVIDGASPDGLTPVGLTPAGPPLSGERSV